MRVATWSESVFCELYVGLMGSSVFKLAFTLYYIIRRECKRESYFFQELPNYSVSLYIIPFLSSVGRMLCAEPNKL